MKTIFVYPEKIILNKFGEKFHIFVLSGTKVARNV